MLVNMTLVLLVLDIRVYRGYDIYTDHFLVKTQIIEKVKWTYKREYKSCYKIHLLQQECIRKLYSDRLKQYTDNRAVSLNVDNEWKELKDTILKVADEILGKRKKTKTKERT